MYESPSDSTDGYLQRTLPPPDVLTHVKEGLKFS